VGVLTRRREGTSPSAQTTELLRLRVTAGAGYDDLRGLTERARRAVMVAQRTGAPILVALDGAMAAEDDAARARRAIAVASAQARAVAIGLIGAPLLLVPALGRLAGADLRAFYTSGYGAVVLAVGVALLAFGAGVIVLLIRRVGRAHLQPEAAPRAGAVALAAGAAVVAWGTVGPALAPLAGLVVHHLVVRRRPAEPTRVGVDEAVDLVATALGGGCSIAEALRVTSDELTELAPPLRRLAFDLEVGRALDPLDARPGGPGPLADGSGPNAGCDPVHRLAEVVLAAEAIGAPAVPTLRRLGADLRAEDLARVLAAAERLPAQLTFPTALCLLPATVLLVGAPIVQAGLAGIGT
jgi:hypothetical protein